MIRIILMYYINLIDFLNTPDADLKRLLAVVDESPPDDSTIS